MNTPIELEKELLEPATRQNATRLNELLDDSFVGYGMSGKTYDKKIILERVPKEDPSEIESFDFTSVQLSPDVIQLRFKTRIKNELALRSSIWRKSEGKWKMIFHQGTRAHDPKASRA